MSELQIEVSSGHVRAIPATVGVFGQVLLAGPGELMGWSFRESGAETGLAVEGSVVSPGAGTTVASIAAVPIGSYIVTWSVQLIGAAAAADQDNFVLVVGATNVEVSLNAGAAGQYPQTGVQVTLSAAQTIAVKAVGAGTVGVTYAAQISIQTLPTGQAVLELQDGNQVLGEVSAQTAGALTTWLGPEGVKFLNQVKAVPIVGNMTGVIYARFGRALGYT